jgi:quinol monooxygenase YgiN
MRKKVVLVAWMQNWEHPDKKKSNKTNYLEDRKSHNKQTDAMSKRDKLMNGLALWVGYWRANPHRFVTEYLQISPFSLFQKILLFMMFWSDYFMWWASRGLGKSHLSALYCIVRCILYPGTKICIAAGTKGQSINIISEKIKGFYDTSINLKREISEIKTNPNEPIVRFHNGSWIKVVAANDNARSSRANVILVDEFRMVDLDVIKKVLKKFLTSRRQPGYLKYPQYEKTREPNTEIYLSSAWLKSHWSWEKFQSFFKAMCQGKKYFTCGMPYQLGVKHGIIDEQRIADEISEMDFDKIAFEMEMSCLPFGESEKAFFTFDKLNKCRNISQPYIPFTDIEFVQHKGDRKKNKFYKSKHPNEIRLLGVDCALMPGKDNDNTVFTFIRCIPQDDEYIKSVEYIETMEGQHQTFQSLRCKQLFYDLECDYCVMDTNGNGLGIYMELTKVTFDNARGLEYPAWSAFNNDKMESIAYDRNAIPLIYSMKITGANAAKENHEMAMYLKAQIESKKLKLLVGEIEGRDFMIEKHNLMKLSSEDTAKMLIPYIQTTRLISEMINLEMDVRGGYIKLTELSGHRKDRYSSLAYALYYLRGLELELRAKEDIDEYDFLSQYVYMM